MWSPLSLTFCVLQSLGFYSSVSSCSTPSSSDIMSLLNGNGTGKDGGALVVVNRIVNAGPVVGFGVAV